MHEDVIQYVPIELLLAEPQVRRVFDAQEIEALGVSICEVGMLQPIRVRKEGDRLPIVDGERRYRAALCIGLATVPVIVEGKPLDEGEILQRQLIANCQRADLSSLEKAVAISQLMQFEACSASQVAAKLALSPATVTRLLASLALPEPIRRQIAAGKISASAAYELAQVKDTAEQAALAEQLVAGTLSRDTLAGKRKEHARHGGKIGDLTMQRATAVLDAERSVTVTAPGLSLDGFIQAIEDVLARARRERTRGVALATFIKVLRDQARS